jgi:cobalt-zinc-cadmium efflux system protein
VIGGVVVLAGGSSIVDPIVSLAISVLILLSSWRLIKEPFDVLMEAAPAGVDVDAAGAAICSEEGVRSVHDLHIWTVTSGFGALAAHVVVSADCDPGLVRRRLELLLHERFGIDHTTLQMEEEASADLLRVENAPPQT